MKEDQDTLHPYLTEKYKDQGGVGRQAMPAIKLCCSLPADRPALTSREQQVKEARQLVDEPFLDHPSMREATARAEAAQRRADAIRTPDRSALQERITQLENQLQQAREATPLAAVDDWINQDGLFSLALAAMDNVQRLEQQLQAARLAAGLLILSPQQHSPLHEQARKARADREDLLLQIKCESLGHPEDV